MTSGKYLRPASAGATTRMRGETSSGPGCFVRGCYKDGLARSIKVGPGLELRVIFCDPHRVELEAWARRATTPPAPIPPMAPMPLPAPPPVVTERVIVDNPKLITRIDKLLGAASRLTAERDHERRRAAALQDRLAILEVSDARLLRDNLNRAESNAELLAAENRRYRDRILLVTDELARVKRENQHLRQRLGLTDDQRIRQLPEWDFQDRDRRSAQNKCGLRCPRHTHPCRLPRNHDETHRWWSPQRSCAWKVAIAS